MTILKGSRYPQKVKYLNVLFKLVYSYIIDWKTFGHPDDCTLENRSRINDCLPNDKL